MRWADVLIRQLQFSFRVIVSYRRFRRFLLRFVNKNNNVILKHFSVIHIVVFNVWWMLSAVAMPLLYSSASRQGITVASLHTGLFSVSSYLYSYSTAHVHCTYFAVSGQMSFFSARCCLLGNKKPYNKINGCSSPKGSFYAQFGLSWKSRQVSVRYPVATM